MIPFEPSCQPSVFSLPPGCNFAKEFTQGLIKRSKSVPPEILARTEVYVNTGRVRQGVIDEFNSQKQFMLPKLRLVSDLANDVRFYEINPETNELRRRLELFQAVSKLLEKDPRFGSKSAAFDLADSLASLLDEMQSEGVNPKELKELDVTQHSAHWEQSLKFINIIQQFWLNQESPDHQARQRLVIEHLVEEWSQKPPEHPVILAGSTGSRGPTRHLMKAVAQLPLGAVVLPCFDHHIPQNVWDGMKYKASRQDHPQFRFKMLFDDLLMQPSEVQSWHEAEGVNEPRNRLVSLALRPAPVTNQWKNEGATLTQISDATQGISLLEAPHPRAEAVAIAFRLRQAVEEGISAALVTPNRRLASQVKAALTRWKINADDCFDVRLNSTLSGRLMFIIAKLIDENNDNASFISLLRHPMVQSGGSSDAYEQHHKLVDRLEHILRKYSLKMKRDELIKNIAYQYEDDPEINEWCEWLLEVQGKLNIQRECISSIATKHLNIAQLLINGTSHQTQIQDETWNKFEGREVLKLMENLKREGASGGKLNSKSYLHLFTSLLAKESAAPHANEVFSNISIWPTVDARMQSPDLLIAGGLNETEWPEPTSVDPWLNREMRQQAKLLMPERRTGLLGHDFQQSVSVKNVVLARSSRLADEPAVPSRWLIRLTTLLAGIGEEGKMALAAMQERGDQILKLSQEMENPKTLKPRETRPNPKPDVLLRPSQLSVTTIKILLTDPYEIYARYILKLRELDPLKQVNLAAARGEIIHKIMQEFVELIADKPEKCSVQELLSLADTILCDYHIPIHMKKLWLAQLESLSEEFVEEEKLRRQLANPLVREVEGQIIIPTNNVDKPDQYVIPSKNDSVNIPENSFKLTARPDRVDLNKNKSLALYDYKTGTLPSPAEIKRRDKQIPLTAKMLELGAFPNIEPSSVEKAAYIGVGKGYKERVVNNDLFDETWDEFLKIVEYYRNPENGYKSRLNKYQYNYGKAFDHLARYGEWEETDNLDKAQSDE